MVLSRSGLFIGDKFGHTVLHAPILSGSRQFSFPYSAVPSRFAAKNTADLHGKEVKKIFCGGFGLGFGYLDLFEKVVNELLRQIIVSRYKPRIHRSQPISF